MVDQILQIVSALRREGMTILLVEQKARQSLAIADQACILETGRIVSHNTAAALLSDRSLAEAYLGTGAAD
jgi:branched-chain amino acid transport system ATP-binding protein